MTSEYATKEEVTAVMNLIKTLRNDLDNRITRSEKMLEKIIDTLSQRPTEGGRALCFLQDTGGHRYRGNNRGNQTRRNWVHANA